MEAASATVVRVVVARMLAIGEASLVTAAFRKTVIVARDVDGFHAVVAVCPRTCMERLRHSGAEQRHARTVSAAESGSGGPPNPCKCRLDALTVAQGSKTPLSSHNLTFSGNDVLVDMASNTAASMRFLG